MKASLFHNSAALVLLVHALGGFLVGQPRSEAHAPIYDLLLTNARIVDGSGNPWVRGDVAVRDAFAADFVISKYFFFMTFGSVAINEIVCKNTRTRLSRLGLLSSAIALPGLQKNHALWFRPTPLPTRRAGFYL